MNSQSGFLLKIAAKFLHICMFSQCKPFEPQYRKNTLEYYNAVPGYIPFIYVAEGVNSTLKFSSILTIFSFKITPTYRR